ncbi:MAG: ATP phosphoribosyltransferase regulatory subunit [Chloroflexi bacterium]|nr:ATP phosphoribosyltransferase regulatory subunit [Chloroflexota bacterium]
MNIARCKGARDMFPQDMRGFRKVEAAFRSSCYLWGYEEIRTPTLEYLHLFTSAGTLSPEMLSRVYSFLDWDGWSGERVVLRPDGTIPSARLYVESLSDMPVARLCYVENVFSFEGTGQESREQWQCGAELIGGSDPGGDAELIMLALEILQNMGIKSIDVKISHVGLFKTLLQELGLDEEEQSKRLKEILTGDVNLLGKIKGESQEVKRFLKLLLEVQGKSLGYLENLKSVLPQGLSKIRSSIDDMAQIAHLLDGIGQEYRVDFASGEGFEYYTGMVFQFYYSGQLMGKGGRYDELIPLVGGGNIPASGFALLMDNVQSVIDTDEPYDPETILLTCKTGKIEELKGSFAVASMLREKGHIVTLDCGCSSEVGGRWMVTLEEVRKEIIVSLRDNRNGKEESGLSPSKLLQEIEDSK